MTFSKTDASYEWSGERAYCHAQIAKGATDHRDLSGMWPSTRDGPPLFIVPIQGVAHAAELRAKAEAVYEPFRKTHAVKLLQGQLKECR